MTYSFAVRVQRLPSTWLESWIELVLVWVLLNCVNPKVIPSSLKGTPPLHPPTPLCLSLDWRRAAAQSRPPAKLTNWISFNPNLCLTTTNYFFNPRGCPKKSRNMILHQTKGTQAWSAAIYQPFICWQIKPHHMWHLSESLINLMKKFPPQLPSEINLLNPNLISFMHIRGIFHLPTYVF